ncbi:MAG: hypothetical protein RPT12_15605 [Vibrio anguillarum]|uniref:hypothetical protein n=1 Tax=Vibrio anguillarum TaxID=55601 RepID=UPI0016B4AC9D|nr:hypothetical protein [Vibrio anguillarum]MDT3848343.1 hypothetical protein [Vibrio anguillarum]NOI05585.1 hypothetical protein [Vibrio anguillarum]
MNIIDNPFNLLKASIRDNKPTLVDLAEDYSLINNDDLGSKYFNELTSPRRRLRIEVSWLLGVTDTIIKDLVNNIFDINFILKSTNLNPLSKANLLASSIEKQSSIDKKIAIELLHELSQTSEIIYADETQVLINQERKRSNFLMVESLEDIEQELEVRKKYYKDSLIGLLDTLSSNDIVEVVTEATLLETNNGKKHCSNLIKEIVGYYELKAQHFLKEEEKNIDTILSIIDDSLKSSTPQGSISVYVEELIRVLRNWDLVAQPIQILYMSQGLKHEMSNNLAYKVRNLSLKLFNEYDYVKLTQRLTHVLQEIFEEDFEFKERSEKDLSDIDDILHDRELAEESSKKFSEEITYQVDIGFAFKNRFYINPEIIEWKGTVIKIADIQYIRWGAISRSSSTEYHISFGNKRNMEEITIRKQSTFSDIVDRLWKTAGVNLLFSFMAALRNDENISIGGVVINDYGIQLEKSNLFSKNEQEFLGWNDIEIYSNNGNFIINKIGDRKMNCTLSYLSVNNVHILESMIRMKFKKPGARLSDALMSD